MVNKFVFAIAGIVVAMAVLIALPNVSQQPQSSQQQDITIEYNRQHMAKEGGLLVTTQLETLSIGKDGSATYTRTDPRQGSAPASQQQQLSLSADELARIKGLILETGFIDVPNTDYPQSQNASDFLSYSLCYALFQRGERALDCGKRALHRALSARQYQRVYFFNVFCIPDKLYLAVHL